MDPILEGMVDLHIHAGPSIAARSCDAFDMMKMAEEAKYKAYVVKDHYFPTTFSCTLANRHVGNGSVQAYGGICLNNSVGLFNLNAVDAAYQMGAKFVCMPTVSSRQHLMSHKGKVFGGSAANMYPETPVYYLDDNGELLPEVKDLCAYLAGKPDLILYTGHGCAAEVDALIQEAVKAGAKRILVNHPFHIVKASIEQITRWSQMGCYIEMCGGLFRKPEPEVNLEMILQNVSIDRLILDTDSGQKGGSLPVDRLLNSIRILREEHGVTDDQLNIMMKKNPSALLGI